MADYKHLLNAPRSALDKMAGQAPADDSWGAAHARAVGKPDTSSPGQAGPGGTGAAATPTKPASKVADKHGWDAAGKRTGAGQ